LSTDQSIALVLVSTSGLTEERLEGENQKATSEIHVQELNERAVDKRDLWERPASERTS
jgi:hypothetical protein